MDINSVKEKILSGEISSPAYVFSQEDFTTRVRKVKSALGEHIDICYSIKANSFLLPILPKEFAKVEVCSPGEFAICKKLNIPSDKIILSGVNKQKKDIMEGLEYGVNLITAESISHIKYIQECAEALDIKASVLVRLSDESQFGIDQEELISIIKNRAAFPRIEFMGLHYFTGTAKTKAKEVYRELQRLKAVVARLEKEASYFPLLVEYGPGLGVDYFPKEGIDSEDTEMTLLKEASLHLTEFLKDMKDINSSFKLTVEMGRFFAASCGYYITKIEDIKNNDGTNYMIVDGGLHQHKYHGQLQGMKIPKVSHIKTPQEGNADSIEDTSLWTVCGSLCTTQDVLTRNLPLSAPSIGDYLIFHKMGAYSVTEGMALFLSRDLPSLYLSSEEGKIITLRERIETAYLNTAHPYSD
ncbi:MAG: alanine racemase [Firmicutes bacterium]|nr:alanine racemase [Bacillota bacterium]